MREHLYKGVCTETGEWVEGDLINCLNGEKIIVHGGNDDDWEPVHPFTVCQFWRMMNDNTRLWEGDKLSDDDPDSVHLVVEWDKQQARLRLAVYGFEMYTNEGGGEEYSPDVSRLEYLDFEDFIFNASDLLGNIHDKEAQNG